MLRVVGSWQRGVELVKSSLPVLLTSRKTGRFAIRFAATTTSEWDRFAGRTALVRSGMMGLSAISLRLMGGELGTGTGNCVRSMRVPVVVRRTGSCGTPSVGRTSITLGVACALQTARLR